MVLRRLCVFCGSSSGTRFEYGSAARALGLALVERKIGLVYGGGRVGLMGAIADTVMANGGEVIGVLPRFLQEREVGHAGITELRLVDSMHQRKALMTELADGFAALPGGLGTFEELFEIWTWGQLGLHAKPCGLLNVAGYYTRMIEFLDHGVQEQLIRPEHRAMLLVDAEPRSLLDRFAQYDAPTVQKWVTAGTT